jgi:hypothetical protein
VTRRYQDERAGQEMMAETRKRRDSRDMKESRIVHVARDNPDMTLELLAERFGETPRVIEYVLNKHGIDRSAE